MSRFEPGLIGRLGRRATSGAPCSSSPPSALVLAMIFAALAIDIGFLAADKRTDQKIADLAALDASRDLTNDPGPGRGQRRPATTFASATPSPPPSPRSGGHGQRPATTSPTPPASSCGSPSRRPASPSSPSSAAPPAHRQGAWPSPAASPRPQFSVGSTLASLDTQKSALDNHPRADAGRREHERRQLQRAGLRQRRPPALQTKLLAMGYDVGTTDKLLNTDIDVADLLTATGQVLTADGDFVAAAEINDIPINLIPNLDVASATSSVDASRSRATTRALDTEINAFAAGERAAQIANGTNFVNVPGINCGGRPWPPDVVRRAAPHRAAQRRRSGRSGRPDRRPRVSTWPRRRRSASS